MAIGDPLGTTQEIRDTIKYDSVQYPDDKGEYHLLKAQAFVVIETRRNWDPNVAGWETELAKTVTVNLASMYALVWLVGGTTEGLKYSIDEFNVDKTMRLQNQLRLIFELKMAAYEGLRSLKALTQTLPKPSTYEA